MPAKNNPPAAFKEYPEPKFPSDKARDAYRKAQGIIKDASQRRRLAADAGGGGGH